MKNFLKLSFARSTLITILGAFICVATADVQAGPISLNKFYEFSFTDVGSPAAGCDPADPAGDFCIPSSGTHTSFLDAPPWTFTAPDSGLTLIVTDAFTAGDRFQVFDFGASLGFTSLPIGSGDCGDDPVPCLADPAVSKGFFALAPGPHSITILTTLAPDGGGAGYLEAAPVPEPATMLLLGAGLAASASVRRRQRRRRAERD